MVLELALLLVVVAILTGLAVWFAVASRHRAMVGQTSSALGELKRLNEQHRLRLGYHPPLRYEFVDRVNSKARYDRYDLYTFFRASRCMLTTLSRLARGV